MKLLYITLALHLYCANAFLQKQGMKFVPVPSLRSVVSGSPDTDMSAKIVNLIMDSPLYFPIVAMAKRTMKKTAQSVGLDWEKKSNELVNAADWMSRVESVKAELNDQYPEYYQSKFHGYSDGNLCISAAVEQEIAGKAVGARNFPNEGLRGEEVLRGSYDRDIINLGGISTSMIADQSVVDLGCGTGTSTRRLARLFPAAKEVIGIDLSPFMIAVGRYLSDTEEYKDKFKWVEDIESDERIAFHCRDIARTQLADSSVSFVSLCLVLHELPEEATISILNEAARILKPGGTLAIMEMDPSAPGYVKLRNTPWLFSILRSTEPFLDDYFNKVAPALPSFLAKSGFPSVRISAATGRHFTMIATKAGVYDSRPSDEEREKSDEHLNTMKIK